VADLDLTAILSAARAAKAEAGSGEWVVGGAFSSYSDGHTWTARDVEAPGRGPVAENCRTATAAHIAVSDPDTVIALVERVQAAEALTEAHAENERLRILHAQTRGLLEQAMANRDEIASERDRLATQLANYEHNHGARCVAEQERYATIAESACRMLADVRAVACGPCPDGGERPMLDVIGSRIATFLSAPGHEVPGLRTQIAARDASIDALTDRIRLLLAAEPWRGQLAELLADRERLVLVAAERGRRIEAMCACNERALEASGRVVTVLDAGAIR
jgi:catechol 2,3-dioxygenase-like lactoylglutathione lyase family enzyme